MPDETIVLTVRIDHRDVEFLDKVAENLCNTRVGVIRFAIRGLQKALAGGQGSEQSQSEQEAASC